MVQGREGQGTSREREGQGKLWKTSRWSMGREAGERHSMVRMHSLGGLPEVHQQQVEDAEV